MTKQFPLCAFGIKTSFIEITCYVFGQVYKPRFVHFLICFIHSQTAASTVLGNLVILYVTKRAVVIAKCACIHVKQTTVAIDASCGTDDGPYH